ncbi:hypothetical protein [Microtetraspora malaysiensis]|uniref:Uncharacterized protein n=1 Tax=Microtetraspora malaysiensis TaxID=161358 RepID=A0ABW6T4N9_9ACTN
MIRATVRTPAHGQALGRVMGGARSSPGAARLRPAFPRPTVGESPFVV